MRRREFITVLGGAAVAWPIAAHAQSEEVRRVGVLMAWPESDEEMRARVEAFKQELRKLGWSERRNLRIDERWPADDMDRVRAYATELISLRPDAILVAGRRTLGVLLDETRSIPVVFAGISDPVQQGIVTNLARPGGNFTGFSAFEVSVFGKMLQTFLEMVPSVARIAVVFNPDNATAVMLSHSFEVLAAQLKVQQTLVSVSRPEQIEHAIEITAREPNSGLFFPPDATISIHRQLVIAMVARHRLPAIYWDPVMVKSGGLMSYGPDRLDIFRRAAAYVDRILRGEKAGDLPVQQPIKFELVINLKTAKALGLTVPPTLLARADEVIE